MRALAERELVDSLRQFDVAIRESTEIVAREAEIDAVPHARELRVMVHFFRVERDAGEEAERFAEILEFKAADERFAAFFTRPAVGNVHGKPLSYIRSPLYGAVCDRC